jgi:hypothetical protein
MTKILAVTAIALVLASAAQAETRIDTLCGSEHRNEVAGPQDVMANPGGYYIVSLRTQLSHGDLRIVKATGEVFHLCTSSAATPDMETTRALLLMQTREVKYLFVPAILDLPNPQLMTN